MKTPQVHDLLSARWLAEPPVTQRRDGGALVFENPSGTRRRITLRRPFTHHRDTPRWLVLEVRANLPNGAWATLLVREVRPVETLPRGEQPWCESIPLQSKCRIPMSPEIPLELSFELEAESTLRLEELRATADPAAPELIDAHVEAGGVLLVTPTCPSTDAEAADRLQARSRAYREAGYRTTLVCADASHRLQCVHQHGELTVLRGTIADLARVLSNIEFHRIVADDFGEGFALAFDRALRNRETPLLLECSGPPDLRAARGGYFEPPAAPDAAAVERWARCVRRFELRRNVTWLFRSEHVKKQTEARLGTPLQRASVVPPAVRPEPGARGHAAASRRIFTVLPLDPDRRHGADLAILTLLELARRPGADRLHFEVHGEGRAREELLRPLQRLSNVTLQPGFPRGEDLRQLYERSALGLFPSRDLCPPLAGLQAATAGVPIVACDVGAAGELIPRDLGLLASPEDPSALADRIAQLVDDPDRLASAGERLAEHLREACAIDKSHERELELLRPALPPISVTTVAPAAGGERLLTIVVPCYNMERHLERCLSTLLDSPEIARAEIVLVDDGSSDGSLGVARRIEALRPDVVRVVAKPNGGHGSAVNRGLEEARGRYFRILDADDWFDPIELGRCLRRLEQEEADLVLTDYSEDWDSQDALVRKDLYGNLTPGRLYDFETLTEPGYGFRGWGPLLSTATFKTECLRRANLRLDEKMAYVDMEYDSLSLPHVHTVRYYALDIYRYSLGREAQTNSRQGFTRRYKQHEHVIFRICDFLVETPSLSEGKRRYVVDKILAPLIDVQFYIYEEYIARREEYLAFQRRLAGYPFLGGRGYESRPFAGGKRARDAKSLARRTLRLALPYFVVTTLGKDLTSNPARALKHLAKFVVPYGIVRGFKQLRSS